MKHIQHRNRKRAKTTKTLDIGEQGFLKAESEETPKENVKDPKFRTNQKCIQCVHTVLFFGGSKQFLDV